MREVTKEKLKKLFELAERNAFQLLEIPTEEVRSRLSELAKALDLFWVGSLGRVRRKYSRIDKLSDQQLDEMLSQLDWKQSVSSEELEQELQRRKLLQTQEVVIEAARKKAKSIDVRTVGFTTRTLQLLTQENLIELGRVSGHTAADLMAIPRFGKHSLGEVRTVLAQYGLALKGEYPPNPVR
ncbi:MAG: DNA-directed RNA polymerase subunit alpha C-terminal domain-containing protein [Patescibacteria group bacterium]